MIPILYDHAEKDFTSQGICRLADAVDCFVTEERNGIYECELKYPIDGLYFEEIFEGRLIGATHDDNDDIQPFEIYKHSAPIDGIVTFYAHHLSYRLRNHILVPFHASSCTEAMSVMKAKSLNYCPFNFFTDVSTLGNFDVEYPVSIKSRLAGDGDSILNLYGPGEFKYDKWNVSFLESRGVDHGVEIRYGKNLTDITREYDESEVYTAIVPYWFKEDSEGHKTLVTLDEYGVIVSESDAVQHVFWTNENDEIIRDEQGHPIEFSSENMIYAPLDLTSEFDDAPTQAQLATRAKQLFEAAQPWLPEDNIKISFVALWQTPEYEDYAPLEKVSLCDIVHVIHTRIGVMVDAEVIKTVYNVLLDRYNEIELGSPQASYADEIASDTQAALEEIQKQLRRSVTADYVNEQIGNATNKITGGLGGYVKVTLNANNEPQEILIMDHPSTATAVNVIRINQAGIGFSTRGYQGPFNSAWLIDGTFDAQVINVVNLAATVIRTGFLTDAQGYNYWNLETGEFRLSSTAMLDTYKEYSYVATRDYAVGDKIEIQTDQDTLIYEVTTTIPKDATIQPGVNVKAATAHTLLDFARKADEAVKALDDELNQQEIFNRLTNNSNNEGIYLENGRLYLNATMLATGIIQDKLATPYNKWNLNTGYFQTASGKIGGFTIADGTSSTLDSTYSDLYYISSGRSWNTPYSAVNTPIVGVGLRGAGDTSSTLGYNVLSQGRMYTQAGSSSSFAGRIRIFSGAIWFDLGLYPGQGTSASYNKWTAVSSIYPYVNTSNVNQRGLFINSALSIAGAFGAYNHYATVPNVGSVECTEIPGNLYVSGNIAAGGWVYGAGGKNRNIGTKDYGGRLLYCYETSVPLFGDIGDGEIGDDGTCRIWLEPIFAQTIENASYQVYLQKYGQGDCYVKERKSNYFIVEGTPGLSFGWELKAHQTDISYSRLPKPQYAMADDLPDNNDFANQEAQYLQNLREGRVTQ